MHEELNLNRRCTFSSSVWEIATGKMPELRTSVTRYLCNGSHNFDNLDFWTAAWKIRETSLSVFIWRTGELMRIGFLAFRWNYTNCIPKSVYVNLHLSAHIHTCYALTRTSYVVNLLLNWGGKMFCFWRVQLYGVRKNHDR